jgi:hypothetical protein
MNSDNPSLQVSIMNTAEYVYDHGDTKLAIKLLKIAIENNPHGRDEHIKLAHSLLRRGEFQPGLRELDWIWKSIFPNQIGIFSNNNSLSNMKILLSADAALGDTIQFCRFSKILTYRGASVTLEVQPELVKLLKQSNLASDVIPSGTEHSAIDFDIRIPFHNLMGVFNCSLNSIPTFNRYLQSNSIDATMSLNSTSVKRIGVCWSGHPNRPYDARRSIPYEIFSKIFSIPNVEFFSLQIDNIPSSFPGINFENKINDCNDTAALIDEMDLVITIDSMAAHLSAALGKPVILLNRLGGCWRWPDNLDYSPWYPSMKIITQTTYNEWESVIDKAISEAVNFLA